LIPTKLLENNPQNTIICHHYSHSISFKYLLFILVLASKSRPRQNVDNCCHFDFGGAIEIEL